MFSETFKDCVWLPVLMLVLALIPEDVPWYVMHKLTLMTYFGLIMDCKREAQFLIQRFPQIKRGIHWSCWENIKHSENPIHLKELSVCSYSTNSFWERTIFWKYFEDTLITTFTLTNDFSILFLCLPFSWLPNEKPSEMCIPWRQVIFLINSDKHFKGIY